MKINKLELINFRQYIDAKFDFTEKVTIINGENGVGKSTLMGSIIYALYGQEELFNTNLMKREGEFLFANNKYITDGSLTEPESVVKIEIEDNNGVRFQIVREYNNITNEENYSVKKASNETGYIYHDLENVEEYHDIIPKEIAPLLFFDGERINSIQEVIGNKMSNNFREEIEKIVKLEEKKKVKNLIDSTRKKIITSSSNTNLQDLQMKDERAQKNIEESYEKLKKINSNIEENKRIKDDITQFLKLNEDAKSRVVKLEKLNTDLKNHENNRFYKEVQLKKDLIFIRPDFIKIQLFEQIKKNINNGEEFYEISGIEQKAIDFIIQNKKCICSTELTDELKYNLNKLKLTLPPESFQSILNATVSQKDHIERSINEKKTYYNEINKSKIDENRLSEEIYQTREKLSDSSDKVHEKETFLNAIELDLENLFRKKGEEEALLRKNSSASEKLNVEINKAMKQNEKEKELIELCNLLDLARKELVSEINDRTENIQYELSLATNEYAKLLLRDSVKIELDKFLKPKKVVLGNGSENVSTGQSVLISLAYLFGLIDIMNNNLRFEEPEKYPIILDGVTASLDPEHISNVIDQTKKYKGQVIILGNSSQIADIMRSFPDNMCIYVIEREKDAFETTLGEKIWNLNQI